MIKIVVPKYIFTPTELLENLAVAFDRNIQKIAPLGELKNSYKNAEIIELGDNTLLFPGLINAHVHLEFSSNKNELEYGDFVTWLHSVIKNRDDLMNNCQDECIKQALKTMLDNGITTIGAISSNGFDLKACATSDLNVVFFNELIGSVASMADLLFNNFLARLDESKNISRDGFYSSIAIHSAYSTHPILIKKALKIAKNENLRVSTHFMESKAEREWLDDSIGDFKEFFANFLKQDSAITNSDEFLENFNDIKTLFTHCTKINDKELKSIKHQTIVHCPISNRLLSNGVLDLKKLDENHINWIVATDGLSSNYKLDLFEELKVAIFMHPDYDIKELAKKLLLSVTKNAAKALNLNKGEIKEGFDADMIVLELDSIPNSDLALHLITKGYNIQKVFVRGELRKGSL